MAREEACCDPIHSPSEPPKRKSPATFRTPGKPLSEEREAGFRPTELLLSGAAERLGAPNGARGSLLRSHSLAQRTA